MKVMLIGSGPQVEGHVTARAVEALRERGHSVVLLDSNPSTTATDADGAERVYLEPLSLQAAQQIVAAEKPDALLAGVTGKTAYDLSLQLKTSVPLWLGPSHAQATPRPVPAGWTVVSLVLARDTFGGTLELCDFEENGDVWTKPAPSVGVRELHGLRADVPLDVGVTRARFAVHTASHQWRLLEIHTVLDGASAFISRACGIDVVKLAVQLWLGEAVPKAPGLGAKVVREGDAVTVYAPASGSGSLVVLGGGNDWSAQHAVRALKERALNPIVIDPNPAALAGDDATRVLAPLSVETCLAVGAKRAIVQFGGTQAVKLSAELALHGIEILGTNAASLSVISDRQRFAARVAELGLPQPKHGRAANAVDAKSVAERIGFPLLAWADGASSAKFVHEVSELEGLNAPLWLEHFLSDASVADVDLLRDSTGAVVVGGIVEHVEQAGVHSADAAYTLPPHSLKSEVVERMKDAAAALARGLDVVGLLNVRFAAQGKAIWVLEANAHASRTLPFVSKATGLNLPRLATQLVLGATLESLGVTADPTPKHCAVREAVFPLAGATLGLDTRSTGEVMAVADSLAAAFGKSQLAAGTALPKSGAVVVAVHDGDKPAVVDLALRLSTLGFNVTATPGTRAYLGKKGVHAGALPLEPTARDMAALICTSVVGGPASGDTLRRTAREGDVPMFTTVEAARLFVAALEARAASERVATLQSFVSHAR